MVAASKSIELSPQKRMKQATCYAEWADAAMAEDERVGASDWKRREESRRYDFKVIRHRLDELREVRASRDPHRLLFWLNEGIHGNTGGMGSTALYRRALVGTKDLVTDYSTELAAALDQLASVPDTEISSAERLDFFHRASDCFGRTAIMFSGGGILGLFHVGVARALIDQDLLPSVISGSSAGSLVAGILGTQRDSELNKAIDAKAVVDAFSTMSNPNLSLKQSPRQMGVDNLRQFIESQIPDLTFAEAFERTGRKINISISPRELHQQPRLMNATTSPNVFIRETVMASCAIPGIFPAVTLAAKNRNGGRQPYVASRQWVDGSVMNDLPARQLSRLYGVNHFITSQTNPVVLWSLRDTSVEESLFGKLWEIGQTATRQTLRATYPVSMKLTERAKRLNLLVRMSYAIAVQDYTADVNIMPKRRFWNPVKLLSILSDQETLNLISEGEAATWPLIEQIRNNTRVSRGLDAILGKMAADVQNSSQL